MTTKRTRKSRAKRTPFKLIDEDAKRTRAKPKEKAIKARVPVAAILVDRTGTPVLITPIAPLPKSEWRWIWDALVRLLR